MEFHRLLAELSGNRVLQAVSALIHGPGLDATEALLDVIAGTHGSEVESVEEHRAVLEAIAAGDPERAEAAMLAHLDRLIEETLEFAATAANENLVDRLLRWMRSEPGRAAPEGTRD
jgi:GntR family L-lactate dehydrogenase operon transcriptional regulator